MTSELLVMMRYDRKRRGRKKLLESSKKATQPNQVDITPVDTSAEHVKQLD